MFSCSLKILSQSTICLLNESVSRRLGLNWGGFRVRSGGIGSKKICREREGLNIFLFLYLS